MQFRFQKAPLLRGFLLPFVSNIKKPRNSKLRGLQIQLRVRAD